MENTGEIMSQQIEEEVDNRDYARGVKLAATAGALGAMTIMSLSNPEAAVQIMTVGVATTTALWRGREIAGWTARAASEVAHEAVSAAKRGVRGVVSAGQRAVGELEESAKATVAETLFPGARSERQAQEAEIEGMELAIDHPQEVQRESDKRFGEAQRKLKEAEREQRALVSMCRDHTPFKSDEAIKGILGSTRAQMEAERKLQEMTAAEVSADFFSERSGEKTTGEPFRERVFPVLGKRRAAREERIAKLERSKTIKAILDTESRTNQALEDLTKKEEENAVYARVLLDHSGLSEAELEAKFEEALEKQQQSQKQGPKVIEPGQPKDKQGRGPDGRDERRRGGKGNRGGNRGDNRPQGKPGSSSQQ